MSDIVDQMRQELPRDESLWHFWNDKARELAADNDRLRKELAEARNKALDETAEYHDDQSAHHSAHKSASNHHEMMAREHRRFADAIRNLKDTTNDQSR